MRANFRPEFVNRIDEYIVFQGLKRDEIRQIVKLQAKRVEERLAIKKIGLDLRDSAVEFLVVSCLSLYSSCKNNLLIVSPTACSLRLQVEMTSRPLERSAKSAMHLALPAF